jgi:hypothetical protein
MQGTVTPHLGPPAADKLIETAQGRSEAERFRFGVFECLGLGREKPSCRYRRAVRGLEFLSRRRVRASVTKAG